MNERDVSEQVIAWVLATCPEIKTGYPYPVASKLGALPDAVAYVTHKRVGPDHQEFPYGELDQYWMRVFNVELSIMVEADSDGQDAHQQLQAIGDTLEQAIRMDTTLGGRVQMTSEQIEFDYSLPFAEYEDGTRGRMLFCYLTVGELAGQPN